MSEIKRKVGDKLRIRAALTGGETNLFVRASLYDQLGAPLSPATVALPHLAKGTYGENTLQMPNKEQIFVRTEVFLDEDFLSPAPRYRDLGLDVYSLDTLDPQQLIPKAFDVQAKIQRKDLKVVVPNNPQLKVVVKQTDVNAVVPDNDLNVTIENKNEIEGVLNE